jgi:hypothetical protein
VTVVGDGYGDGNGNGNACGTEPCDVGNVNGKGNGNARCTGESMLASFVQHAR